MTFRSLGNYWLDMLLSNVDVSATNFWRLICWFGSQQMKNPALYHRLAVHPQTIALSGVVNRHELHTATPCHFLHHMDRLTLELDHHDHSEFLAFAVALKRNGRRLGKRKLIWHISMFSRIFACDFIPWTEINFQNLDCTLYILVSCNWLPTNTSQHTLYVHLPTTSRFTTLFLVGDNLKSTLHRKSPESSACKIR